MTAKRIAYFVFFTISSLFFVTQLLVSPGARLADDGLIKSTALLVIVLVFYISQSDKPYLVKSTPLRLIIGVTGLLGMVVMALAMGVV